MPGADLIGQLKQLLDDLRHFYDWISSLDNWHYLAGDTGALNTAAAGYAGMARAMQELKTDLNDAVTRQLFFGRDGNWNDRAAQEFQKFLVKFQKEIDTSAGQFNEMSSRLKSAATQVDSFNSAAVSVMVEMGIWIAATAILIWIPIIDGLEALAAVVRGVFLLRKIAQVIELIVNLLKALRWFFRLKLVSGFFFNVGAFYIGRFADRWYFSPNHDPTKGWQPTDNIQIQVGSLMGDFLGLGLGSLLGKIPFASVPFLRQFPGMTALASRFAGNTTMTSDMAVNQFWRAVLGTPIIGSGVGFAYGLVNQGFIMRTSGSEFWTNVGNAALWGGIGGFVGSFFRGFFTYRSPVWDKQWGAISATPFTITANTAMEITLPFVRDARGIKVPPPPPPLPTGYALINGVAVPVGGPPTHIVKPGDTLWDIAVRQYGSDAGLKYWDIVRRNHIKNPDLIHPGDNLVLPPVTPPPSVSGHNATYVTPHHGRSKAA